CVPSNTRDGRALVTGPAQPLKLALLEEPQKLGLDGRCHLRHLVEEQHAARRLLDPPGPRGLSPGEGAPLVAEQLGLQELLRQGGAVERDERLFGAWRRAVDVAGDD